MEPIDPAQLKLNQALVDTDLATLQARIDAAIASNPPIDPTTVVLHNHLPIRIIDIPNPAIRNQHGYGHFQDDITRRPIIQRSDSKEWKYTPTTCCIPTGGRGVWVDDQHLACPGCGVDFT